MNALLVMMLRDYVSGEMPFERMQDVILDITWDGKDVDPDAKELADEVDLRIAEFTGGHITEEELKALIREAISPLTVFTLSGEEHAAQARLALQGSRSSAPTQRRSTAFE